MDKKKQKEKIGLKQIHNLMWVSMWVSLAATALNFFLAEFVWDNGENVFIHLILTIILCVPSYLVIWVDWVPKESKIITSVSFAILMLAPIVFSHKIELLVDFVISIFIISLMISCVKTKKTVNVFIWIFELVYVFCVFGTHFTNYAYVNLIFFPLWQVAVLVGLIIGIFYVVNDFRKKEGSFLSIVVGFGLFGLVFVFVGIFFIHLNYALDFSEPQRYELIIEEKEYAPSSGGRYSTPHYKFLFNLNGKEINLWVSSSEYEKYEVGDLYAIDLYNGALGEPFYISGKYD